MNDMLDLFKEIEEYADENNIPIINKVSSLLLIETVKFY